MSSNISRREVLQKLGVAGSVVFAGCSAMTGDEPTTSVDGTTTTDQTSTQTATAEPTAENTQTATPEEPPCREPESRTPRWRTTTDSRTYDPVVADGIVYVGGDKPDTLRAFDLTDGTEQWRTAVDGMLYVAPAVGEDALYYPEYDRVTALSRTDGTERWRHEPTGDLTAPATAADGLVVFGESNHPTMHTTVDDEFDRVVALDAADGSVRWRQRFAPNGRAPLTTRPVTLDASVVAASEDHVIRAFELADGAAQWSTGVSVPSDMAAFSSGGNTGVVVASREGTVALDPVNGTIRWRDGRSSERVVAGGGRVFVARNDVLRALDVTDGSALWTHSTTDRRLVGLAVDAEHVVASFRSETGKRARLTGFDPQTGCPVWHVSPDVGRLSSPAIGDDTAVVTSGVADRSVYAVGATGE